MTRILIIEDEESYREALAYMLRKEGFEIVEAADGAGGLAVYERVGADLVLLDLMMPEMNGFDFLVELRKVPACKELPVIVVTAATLSAEDHRRLNGSVEKVLAKGDYTRDELLDELRQIAARYLSSEDRTDG
jgi:adenylate cyclase